MGLPTPNTRKEQFLNAIATGNSDGLPTPITREEEYLNAIANSGGGGGEGDMKKSVYDSDLDVAGAGGIKAFVNDALAGKQDKTDNNLQTADKTILGAINEVNSGLNKSWSLDGGISIANNTDLNDITTVGNYYATTAASATLSHCPITGAFKLKVLYDVRETAPAYIEQVFNPMSSYDEYRRYKSGSAAWSDWHLTNCNLDEERGKVADNAEAIEAMVNVNGCCNVAVHNCQSTTIDDATFTVNADSSITATAPITGAWQGVVSTALFKLKGGVTYKLTSGLPATSGFFMQLRDENGVDLVNTYQVTEATYTPSTDMNCKVIFLIHNGYSMTSDETLYPMIHDARLNPTGYVPYAMTNRELTERFAVVTGTTESDTNITSIPYPQGFTRDNTFIVTLAIYISSRWYQYNNTNTFYAVTINGGIEVVAEDSTVRGKPIKLLLMRA